MRPIAASRTIFGTALAALCCVGAVSAHADDLAVRHEIEAAHAQQVRADASDDAALWREMYQNVVTNDFTLTDQTGMKQSREQFKEHQLHALPDMKGAQEEFHIQHVKQTGNKATEEGYLTYRVTVFDIEGRMGPKGKKHVVTGRSTYNAEWVKVGTSWKAATLHLLKHEEQTDGKPSGK